jgi:N utilization substance protein B
VASRREGRELAVQALYQLEVTGDEAGADLGHFWQQFPTSDTARDFAMSLVEGVRRERRRIDTLLAGAAEHWRVPRLSKVDASVLRVAIYELLSCPDVPTRVSIDEAIEIARRFGTGDSAAFVNGVLDRVADDLGVKGRGDNAGDALGSVEREACGSATTPKK